MYKEATVCMEHTCTQLSGICTCMYCSNELHIACMYMCASRGILAASTYMDKHICTWASN